MSSLETRNIDVVRRYFDGCNSGVLEDLLATLAPDVSHFFLPTTFAPIKRADIDETGRAVRFPGLSTP